MFERVIRYSLLVAGAKSRAARAEAKIPDE
jgi:hypothetical protein